MLRGMFCRNIWAVVIAGMFELLQIYFLHIIGNILLNNTSKNIKKTHCMQ